MAKQTINQGTAPTGAGGDTFRSGSAKLQANDDELYNQLGATAQGVLPAALPVNKGGTGATTAAVARNNLGLGSAATATLTTSAYDNTAGRVLKVGDFGLGAVSISISGATFAPENFSNIPAMIGYVSLASNTPEATSDFAGKSFITLPTNNTTIKAAIGIDATTGELLYRSAQSSAWSNWYKVRSGKNTTVDSNGFIKSASPIVELYADHITLNDEASEQPITFEKLGIGDYLIKGSSGFAQEGWYIETPKDANGNVLFSVIYATLENGDISVKTYKKKFDFETVSIVADLDNPVDITENRWIDLRLQELPQPEIEGSESIAPPEFQPTGLAQAVATVMESYHDPE